MQHVLCSIIQRTKLQRSILKLLRVRDIKWISDISCPLVRINNIIFHNLSTSNCQELYFMKYCILKPAHIIQIWSDDWTRNMEELTDMVDDSVDFATFLDGSHEGMKKEHEACVTAVRADKPGDALPLAGSQLVWIENVNNWLHIPVLYFASFQVTFLAVLAGYWWQGIGRCRILTIQNMWQRYCISISSPIFCTNLFIDGRRIFVKVATSNFYGVFKIWLHSHEPN